MKKALLLPIMLCILLVLSACGGNAEDEFGSFCAELEQAQSIGFTAKLRAEYEDKTANFKLAYTQNAEGIKVTVIEPETISGISARVKDDSARLEYDGVILDIVMPEVGGIETLQVIKEINPDLPVIMLSSAGTSQKLKETLELGALDFIQKPYTSEQIKQAVERIRRKVEENNGK